MKDRINPCISYTNCGGTCLKGVKNVTMEKCKHCDKYRPRKSYKKPENVKSRRQKDRDRHDNWKTRLD